MNDTWEVQYSMKAKYFLLFLAFLVMASILPSKFHAKAINLAEVSQSKVVKKNKYGNYPNVVDVVYNLDKKAGR